MWRVSKRKTNYSLHAAEVCMLSHMLKKVTLVLECKGRVSPYRYNVGTTKGFHTGMRITPGTARLPTVGLA
jgi:hypothetical protein